MQWGSGATSEDDDEAEDGRIVRLSKHLRAEYELITGETLAIFVDREGIEWGNQWRAIALHINVRVKGSRGVAARLVHIASALDVAGLRFRRLGPEPIRTVEAEWPREESFPDDIWTAWACEAAAHPTCRARLLNVWGRFRHKIYRTHPPRRGAVVPP